MCACSAATMLCCTSTTRTQPTLTFLTPPARCSQASTSPTPRQTRRRRRRRRRRRQRPLAHPRLQSPSHKFRPSLLMLPHSPQKRPLSRSPPPKPQHRRHRRYRQQSRQKARRQRKNRRRQRTQNRRRCCCCFRLLRSFFSECFDSRFFFICLCVFCC